MTTSDCLACDHSDSEVAARSVHTCYAEKIGPVKRAVMDALCSGGEEQISLHATHSEQADAILEALQETGYVVTNRLTELQDGLHDLIGVWRRAHDSLIRADTGREQEAETLERCAGEVQRVLRGNGPGGSSA